MNEKNEISKKITLIENAIESDLSTLVIRLINAYDLKFERETPNTSSPIIRWLDFVTRRVEEKPRLIFESKEIKSSIPTHLAHQYNELKRIIRSGGDLNPFQSKGLISSNDTSSKKVRQRTDLMLADWGIYHFHLGTLLPAAEAYFSSRSSHLVFCLIKNQFVCLIDIRSHDDVNLFSDTQILEVAVRNWRNLLDPHRVKVMTDISNADKNPAEISESRKRGMNSAIRIGNDYYFGIGGGITGANTSAKSTYSLIKLNKLIFAISHQLASFVGLFEISPLETILRINESGNLVVVGKSDEFLSQYLREIQCILFPAWVRYI